MKVYIVVTEEYYGGDKETVKVFKDRKAAEAYQDLLISESEGKTDVIVVEKEVQDDGHGTGLKSSE